FSDGGKHPRRRHCPRSVSPIHGGVVRAAARATRQTIRTTGVRRDGHYGFVTTSQTPRSDASAPTEQRRPASVVEFGLGFCRMDAATRASDLRKMKRFATSLLLVAAVIFLAARWWEVNGGPVWIGYVRAMAEAGMVGGLADWFAVTALFRRPLRLPIPHTAVIPPHR